MANRKNIKARRGSKQFPLRSLLVEAELPSSCWSSTTSVRNRIAKYNTEDRTDPIPPQRLGCHGRHDSWTLLPSPLPQQSSRTLGKHRRCLYILFLLCGWSACVVVLENPIGLSLHVSSFVDLVFWALICRCLKELLEFMLDCSLGTLEKRVVVRR